MASESKEFKLNEKYYFIRCLSTDSGAMNGFTFDAPKECVIVKDS